MRRSPFCGLAVVGGTVSGLTHETTPAAFFWCDMSVNWGECLVARLETGGYVKLTA
jgi:hypothetical protein